MGAWEWDIESGRVVWSPGLQQIHGLQPGGFPGDFETFKRDIHPGDLDVVLAEVRQAVDALGDCHIVYRIKRPDGAVRWLEAFGRASAGAEGKARKLAGVCMDITERKEAELQRDLLVAELSHRVRNMLATVISVEHQSFLNPESIEEARSSFGQRIRALAQSHGRLAEGNWVGVSLEAILRDELAPYRGQDGSNLDLVGPPVSLNPKCAP
ncbi:MAG: HWE histidine kinase domain-containing protein [Methyloceanibacter sp.]